jgi:hypothetical protein
MQLSKSSFTHRIGNPFASAQCERFGHVGVVEHGYRCPCFPEIVQALLDLKCPQLVLEIRMTLAAAVHLVLHAAVPGAVAWLFFHQQWRRAWLIMLAAMFVDLDHLLADPIYDPNRCGIGFHPLHTAPAIMVYAVLAVVPRTRLVGLGLVIHMALDLADCAVQGTVPL